MPHPQEIRTVGVIGTGVIGLSWITLFLSKGLRVIVSDPAPNAVDQLRSYIAKQWPVMEKLGLEKGASQTSFEFVDEIFDHLDKIDFIQENGPERLDFKQELFAKLDSLAPEHVILSSSSSGLPSSQFIGNCDRKPSRILIGHPFNPPHLVPLVEVVPHPGTDATATARAMDFYRSLGKQPILVRTETPGFVANRLQAALLAEAYSLVKREVVSATDVDAAVTTSLGPRWALTGPLMTNALGGGGSAEGFRHLLEHIGVASQIWLEDMRAKEFDWSVDSREKLVEEVAKMFAGMKGTSEELIKQRDEALIELLKLKKNGSLLV
ncbi:3-hydroxyacyl- dehyrogenase [Trichoderma arundinaceum]|uniref:3-hydroxyacyl-dehyrogenase n=1 Tax=Trichoderma arundinaceum TaxID=490622 RepID=A0A395NJJ3_TRIAR|nr:3-hydroxyacyl- dehyrogenase [Trichoderma arundinaceum]